MLINHPENIHHCTQCDYKAKRLDNLQRHMKVVHKVDTRDVCKYCTSTHTSSVEDEGSDITENDTTSTGDEESNASMDYSNSDESIADSVSDDDETDNESIGSEEQEVETLSDGADDDKKEDGDEVNYNMWKNLKRKAMKAYTDDDSSSILNHTIRLYVEAVYISLLLDKDKLHKKNDKVYQKASEG